MHPMVKNKNRLEEQRREILVDEDHISLSVFGVVYQSMSISRPFRFIFDLYDNSSR